MLLDLVGEWAGILNDAHAGARMQEIEAGLDETYFAWSGPTTQTTNRAEVSPSPTAVMLAKTSSARSTGWCSTSCNPSRHSRARRRQAECQGTVRSIAGMPCFSRLMQTT